MTTEMFLNQVRKIAEDNDISFILLAEGFTTYRGDIDKILKPATIRNERRTTGMVDTKCVYYDLFKCLSMAPMEDPPVPFQIDSRDLEDFSVPSNADYYMVVASHRHEFSVFAGTFEDGGFPIISVTKANNDVVISALEHNCVGDDDDPVDEIITKDARCISSLTQISGSLTFPEVFPTYIAVEIEAFMISAIHSIIAAEAELSSDDEEES